MRVLSKTPFNGGALFVMPGDILHLTYRRDGAVVTKCSTEIEETQTLDSAVLVEYDEEEAASFGMDAAFGTFAGESR